MTTAHPSPEKLIDQCQGLVRSLAVKIHRGLPPHIELDDLVAYGQLGLAEAARDFNPQQGSRFSTYAYYRIRGAIYDGLSKMSWTSRARYNRLRNEQMANQTLQADSESPAAESLQGDARWFVGLTERLAVVHLATNSEDDQGRADAALQDPDAPAPATVAADREIQQRLNQLIDELPEEAGKLVRATYFQGLTLQDAAKQIGVSKSWASRLHAKTLESLARSLRQIGAAD